MVTLVLDLTGVTSLDEFHDRVAEALKLPDHYGRNLDAFWDCLTELVGRTTVRVVGLLGLDGALRTQVDRYLKLLVDQEAESRGEFSVSLSKVDDD
ncbi:MAG: barstar family protein [Acidobacteriota bacterium]